MPPKHISLDARRLALQLGLGDLIDRKPCHGYTTGCHCERCNDRDNRSIALQATMSHADAAKIAKRDSDDFYRRHAHRDFNSIAA